MLQVQVKRLDAALKTFLKPDLLNVAFLGNEFYMCHGHVIPRYATPPIFQGQSYPDENFGHNYSRPNVKGPRNKLDPEVRAHLLATLQALWTAGQ
jgi:diadenosine tetraphosphate (Ap4A) HIT family hydrolase